MTQVCYAMSWVLRKFLGMLLNDAAVLGNTLEVLRNFLSVLRNDLGVLQISLYSQSPVAHHIIFPWQKGRADPPFASAKVKNAIGRIGIFILGIHKNFYTLPT